MTIENRTLYNLYQTVKTQYAEAYLFGLYIEGFSGGVTVYAKGKALYRQTFYGDNKARFCAYIGEWQKKDGETDTVELDQTRKMDGDKAAQQIGVFNRIFWTLPR